MSSRSTALIAVVSLFPFAAANAATPVADELGEIIVTATRNETPLQRLTMPVLVIDRAEIEQSQAQDVAELLDHRAGIEIARTGGPGQPASIFMRGTESNHTAVLIDGVRINPGTIGGAALQNVLPESIERIEVVKGARSALYGTDAIGGVINLITRAGSARGATASAAAGRYDTQQYALDGGVQLGETAGLGGNIAYRSTDGFAPQTVSTNPRGYDNLSANLHARWQPSEQLDLKALAWRATGTSEYLGYDPLFNFGPIDQDYRNAVYDAGIDYRPGDLRLRLDLSQAEDFIDQNQSGDFAHTRRRTADGQFGWKLGEAQQLSLGVVASSEHTKADSFGTSFDVDTDVVMAYAQDQLQLGANELLLAISRVDHETFGTHDSWNAEYGRAFSSNWHVTAAAGTAFHAPDSTDRFGYGGNPDLQPERSRQYELGLRWQGRTQQLQLQAFENRIDNLILFALVDPVNFIYRSENGERARIRGLEASYEWRSGPWQLAGSATLQEPRNLTTDQPLLRRARRHYDLRLQHSAGALVLAGELSYSGARYDSSFPSTIRLPGYALLNASASWQISQRWKLQLKLDNALDREYTLVNGYNTPRRSVTIATRYQLQ